MSAAVGQRTPGSQYEHAGHDHDHRHHDDVEHHHEPVPQGGPVVLDIGGDIGALVVYLDPELEGTEFPIECEADPSIDVHSGVWRRSIGDDTVVIAVFGSLRSGRYRIPSRAGHDAMAIDIIGGQVTELFLPS